MAEGTNWGKAIGDTLKIAAIGAAVVAGVSLLPQGLQMASDGLSSLAGNATDGTLVSASNALGSSAQTLSSAYVDVINWGKDFLGTSVDPEQILANANVKLDDKAVSALADQLKDQGISNATEKATEQLAAQNVFTNWDTYKTLVSEAGSKAGDAASQLWNYAQNNKLAVGAAAGAVGLTAYQLGKSGSSASPAPASASRPTVGPHTAALNAREAARQRLAAAGYAPRTV